MTDGPQGEVWSTFSTIDGLPNATFGIILVADLTGSYNLHPSDTGLSFQVLSRCSLVIIFNLPLLPVIELNADLISLLYYATN